MKQNLSLSEIVFPMFKTLSHKKIQNRFQRADLIQATFTNYSSQKNNKRYRTIIKGYLTPPKNLCSYRVLKYPLKLILEFKKKLKWNS